MASLTYSKLDKLMKPHDVPYSWPERTCLHPVRDLMRFILQSEPSSHFYEEITRWSEDTANLHIKNHYSGSWFLCMLDYLEKNGYGHSIDPTESDIGDIIEFEYPLMILRLPEGITGVIGIKASNETLFTRIRSGVCPLPIVNASIKRAARIERTSV